MKFLKTVMILLSFIIVFNLTACSSPKVTDNTVNSPGASPSNSQGDKTSSGDYVATIGDLKVSVPDFTFYLNASKNQMLSTAKIDTTDSKAVNAFWEGKTGNVTNSTVAKNNCLESIKELKILLSKAKDDKIQLDNNDLTNVKSFIDSAIQQQGNGDKAQAEAKLKQSMGVNFSEYESIYKDYILAYTKYAAGEASKIEVSDADMKAQYDNNPNKYNKVTVKHVLILTSDSATGSDLAADKLAEKEKLANDILNKAKAGEDFEGLVKQYTEDPGSKDKGGEYTFGKGEMVSEFENWSFNAKPGDIGMVKSVYGYHIIKFIKKSDFESQKDTIKAAAQSEKFQKKLEEWKKDDKYKVVVNQKVFDSIKLN